MAIPITEDEINVLCPNSLPDAVITDLICTVADAMEACVESAYVTCKAKSILQYAICHLVQNSDGGEVKSERAPNGSSTTYENHNGGEGLKSTSFGRLVISLDTSLCYNALFAPTFLFLSAGDPATPGEDC